MRAFAVVVGVIGLWGAGCNKKAPPPANPDTATEEEVEDEANTVDPDMVDRVQRVFEGKRIAVGRCFGEAVEAGTLDKKKKGSITFEMTITPAGKAEDVEAVKDSLGSPEVTQCATALITGWDLPRPATSMPFSFVYNFEVD
jgi:hypothetical protein